MLATVLANVLDGFHAAGRPVLVYGVDVTGTVCFAALRTPPWFMLTSELPTGSATELVRLWLELDSALPGVSGLPAAARAVAGAWAQQTGGSTACGMAARVHR